MVLASVLIPISILLYTKCKKTDEDEKHEEEDGAEFEGRVGNPMFGHDDESDDDIEEFTSPVAGSEGFGEVPQSGTRIQPT